MASVTGLGQVAVPANLSYRATLGSQIVERFAASRNRAAPGTYFFDGLPARMRAL